MQNLYQEYHQQLPERIRLWLNNRGVINEVINRHFIGWDSRAITIPIFDKNGNFSFFKFRKDPDDTDEERPKYWYEKGTSAELYGWDNVRDGRSPLIIAEGELDCLTLESNGFAAITGTGGAGTFKKEWAPLIPEDVSVFVCFDHDDAGRKGMRKVAELLPQAKIVLLPPEVGEHGDITDFFATLGKTPDDFRKLLDTAKTLNEIRAGFTLMEPQKFQFTPLIVLLNEPEEKINWVVEDLLPSGGFSIMVAKPKVGKSTLARQLALAVARGEPFLGRNTVKGGVLYVSLEEKRQEVKNHFKIMAANGTEDLSVYVGSAPEEAYKWLEDEVERQRPILIIIDTLFRFARVADLNDYAKTIAALDPLLTLARTHSAHLMGIHHARKSPGDGADTTLGSTAIFGTVDTAVVLKRTEGKRTIETQQRYGVDMEPTVLVFDPASKITTLGGTKEEDDTKNVENAIMEYLKSAKEPVSESVIDGEVEGKTIFKRAALRRLLSKGEVMRTGGGKRGDPFLYSCSLVPAIYEEQEKQAPESSEKADTTGIISRSTDFEDSLDFGNERIPLLRTATKTASML